MNSINTTNSSINSLRLIVFIIAVLIITLTSCSVFRNEADKGRSYLYFNPYKSDKNQILDSLTFDSTYNIRCLKIEESSLANDNIIICASDSSDNQFIIISKTKEKPPRGATFLEKDKCYYFVIKDIVTNPKYESSYNSYENSMSFKLGKNIILRCPITTAVVEAQNLTGQWIKPIKMANPELCEICQKETMIDKDSVVITSVQKMKLKNFYEVNDVVFCYFVNDKLSFWIDQEYRPLDSRGSLAKPLEINKEYQLILYRCLSGMPNAGIRNWKRPMVVVNTKKEFITRPTWPSTFGVANILGKYVLSTNASDTLAIKH